MILVIDERAAALMSDCSNADISADEYTAFLARAQSGTEPSAIVRITQDGVFVEGADKPTIVTVKSEREMSLAKAVREREARNAARDAAQHRSPEDQRNDAMSKVAAVFDDPSLPSNSGTEELKGL